jgi:N-methylhydantoinase B
MARRDYDIIAAEVHRQALENITKEMATTLVRTSGSPAVTDAKDFSTALFDVDGEHIGFSGYVSFHIASSLIGVEAVRENHTDFAAGDFFICNDPHTSGAIHQGDVGIVTPMFYRDEIVGWGFANAHLLDVGGVSISGMAPDARDCFAEALRFPGTRIAREGRIDPQWEQFIATNVRIPTPVLNDIRSMIAANNVGQQKLTQLIDDFGLERHNEYIAVNKELSERALRGRIEQLPDGVYVSDDWNEYDGQGISELYHLHGELVVQGDELTLRFTSEHEQASAFINGTRAAVWGQAMTGVFTLFAYDIPVNAGIWGPITIDIGEPGTVVNAVPPAPVTNSHQEVGMRICKLTTDLLSQACSFSDDEQLRERVAGQAQNGFPAAAVFGQNQFGQPHVMYFIDPPVGIGGGAQTTGDGQDAYGCQCMLGCGMPDVELHEADSPVLFLWRRIEPNTGGPGQRRGGQAMNQAFVLRGTKEMAGPGFNAVAEVPPQGFGGGLPASAGIFYTITSSNVTDAFGKGLLPTPETIEGQRVDYPNKTGYMVLNEDDIFVTIGGGGGGLGDPLLREPAHVARDVVDGYVTPDHAQAVYGVVLDAENVVDDDATQSSRAAIRADRQQGERREAASPQIPGVVLSLTRDGDGEAIWSCLCCAGDLGSGAWREHASSRETPVADLFDDWKMRVRAREEERVVVREFFCPHCSTQLSADIAVEGFPELLSPRPLDAGRESAPAAA